MPGENPAEASASFQPVGRVYPDEPLPFPAGSLYTAPALMMSQNGSRKKTSSRPTRGAQGNIVDKLHKADGLGKAKRAQKFLNDQNNAVQNEGQ